MSLYDVLLFLHVFGAFALVAGTTAMAPFALDLGRGIDRGEVVRWATVGTILSGVGATLTLVIGLWLVGERGYAFLRLWILGALVLWAVAGYSNDRVGRAARGEKKGDGRIDVRALWYADALGATLLLAIMIFKPGH
jgi:uncharacterized membrane protein